MSTQLSKAAREMVGLAAKAAGLAAKWNDACEEWCIPGEYNSQNRRAGDWRIWSPLNDDGDALRLAVKLDLVVTVNRIDGWTQVKYGYLVLEMGLINEHHGADPYAATRRAIVRAAAELGKRLMGKQPDTRPICSADGCSLREPCGPFCRDRGNFDQHSRKKSQPQPGGRVVIGIKQDSDDPMPVPVYSDTYAAGAQPEPCDRKCLVASGGTTDDLCATTGGACTRKLQPGPDRLTESQIEFALNCNLEDPSDDESRGFYAGARWAEAFLAKCKATDCNCLTQCGDSAANNEDVGRKLGGKP